MDLRSFKHFSMLFISHLWIASFVLCAAEFSIDEEIDEALRLHLSDKRQELSTTSINWIDLGPQATTHSVLAPHDNTFRVLIDPGHGGRDRGAQGLFGVSEKVLSLEVGRKIRKRVHQLARAMGMSVEVKLSRDKDSFLTLKERVQLANEWKADLFISIHANSTSLKSPRGFEVYFLSSEASDAETKALAKAENGGAETREVTSTVQSILQDLQANHHVSESGIFAEKIFETMRRRIPSKRGVRQGPFTVLSGTTMPAVLIEIGYVSNPIEAGDLSNPSYLKRLSGAISEGIIEYLQNRQSKKI